jgi:ribosomal protein S18 acetylase RimI-like enzyme
MIAPAAPEDEAAVAQLWRDCGLVVAYNDPVADFRLALGRPTSDILLHKNAQGAVIASAMVGHDGHRGWLYYVAVHPAHQGRGLGKAMVAAAENWMAAQGIGRAQLMVRETNPQMVGFYEKLGFEVIPRILMRKVLETGKKPQKPG